MASKGTKGFVAILVIICGLLVLNFTVIDFASAVGKAWKKNLQSYQGKLTHNDTKESCGKVTPVGECKDCMKHQLIDLQQYPECAETGKRQKSLCSISKKNFYVGCYTNEEKKFWVFQMTALLVGCLSSAIVWCRSRHLDEHVLGRIRKQITGES